jgi:UDP-N-acetyl-D-mannosaminuronic acid dehydrogenase
MKVVVIGMGYVGVPVASALADAGHDVLGIDIDPRKVEDINAGRSPLLTTERELEEMLSRVVSSGSLKATGSYEECRDAEVVIICVDTPVQQSSRTPDYRALLSALEALAPCLRRGALVSVESTLSPGTMRDLVRPTLEEGSGMRVHEDFHLVHCPERVTPGRLLHNLVNLDRVVGGEVEESRRLAIQLYSDICRGTFHETNWVNAELCKTVENAYRDVQLAFANEVALLCERAGGDAFRVRELVNTCPGRSMLLPGPGVGGHCITKDSWLLTSAAREEARLIPAAREVNEGMPGHVAELVSRALEDGGGEVKGSHIVILGAAYRENIRETNNSPGLRLREILTSMGAEVRIHDPHVPPLEGVEVLRDLDAASEDADCLVLVTSHDAYREVDWGAIRRRMRGPLVVDCRGFLETAAMEREGFRYYGLGRPLPQDSSTG